mmetsp:Transcript_106152/g.300599  ORF Transcript_106152/g.300599 Transcript_106152/m.300599 type:complete len:214 (-) Transcript_106152:448-1089(-)
MGGLRFVHRHRGEGRQHDVKGSDRGGETYDRRAVGPQRVPTSFPKGSDRRVLVEDHPGMASSHGHQCQGHALRPDPAIQHAHLRRLRGRGRAEGAWREHGRLARAVRGGGVGERVLPEARGVVPGQGGPGAEGKRPEARVRHQPRVCGRRQVQAAEALGEVHRQERRSHHPHEGRRSERGRFDDHHDDGDDDGDKDGREAFAGLGAAEHAWAG